MPKKKIKIEQPKWLCVGGCLDGHMIAPKDDNQNRIAITVALDLPNTDYAAVKSGEIDEATRVDTYSRRTFSCENSKEYSVWGLESMSNQEVADKLLTRILAGLYDDVDIVEG